MLPANYSLKNHTHNRTCAHTLSLSHLHTHTYTHARAYVCIYVCMYVCMYVYKSWRQHPSKQQLYDHLPPITKTIQVRRTRHAGHCWRSRDELISDVLLRTPAYGREKAGQPARTYIQQLCKDTGCSPEDLLEAINDRERWREKVRDIRAGGTTWWYYLPTPPLGQDMTQGQFLSGV